MIDWGKSFHEFTLNEKNSRERTFTRQTPLILNSSNLRPLFRVTFSLSGEKKYSSLHNKSHYQFYRMTQQMKA